MTIWDPIVTQGNGTTPSYSAQELRFGLRAEDWNEGVRMRHHCRVTQRGAGANMSVDVAAGDAIVTGDDISFQGNIAFRSTAVVNVTGFVAPSGSNQRYDLVVIRLTDANALGAGTDGFTIERVTGTPATSNPAVPAVPASCLPIAVIGPMVSGTGSIVNSLVHDAHTGTGPAAAATVRLVAGFRDRPGHSKETYATVADSGWALEFGQAISRSANPGLFDEIGVQHGVGDGSTTFNLPDSRGRAAVARDNMGGADAGIISSSNALGWKMGEETHALSDAENGVHTHGQNPHGHTFTTGTESAGHIHGGTTATETQSHTHGPAAGTGVVAYAAGSNLDGGVGGGAATGLSLQATSGTQSALHDHTFTTGTESALHTHSGTVTNETATNQSSGSSTPHNNMQPSITVNRMICLG